MLVTVTFGFVAIATKLAFIQGVNAQHYLTVGQSEWTHAVALAGERGAILDRNGDELAMSVPQTTIYADPRQVSDPRAEATSLSPLLGVSEATLQNQLSADAGFVYLARTQPNAVAAAVAKLDLAGIYSLQEPKRFNPAGQLALPLLGTVGTAGAGLSGLEAKYNNVLSGKPGRLVEELDPQGGQIPGGLQQYQAPAAGQDVVLTLDEPLQYETEQTLAEALVAAHGKSGIALLMDSKTGDLLAAANLSMPDKAVPPTTSEPAAVPVSIPSTPVAGNPATGSNVGPQPVESPSASAFTEVYEPGSVNKLITISAALSQGVIVPSTHFVIPNSYDVAGTKFSDAENHPAENWSVTDILANSSNIGTIQIAQRLGKANLLRYLNAYGIGNRTDIAFPGESKGLLPTYWSGTSIATVPIGQGISVTAVQMLAAYNTIANGGEYIPPRLVEGTVDTQGKLHRLRAPAPHRVVTPTVANQMRTMLEQVVLHGTGTSASIPPYDVAGKTGTALVPKNGGYESGHYVASFVGYVPAEKPAITVMVQIYDTPDYGAAASAPAFATIARDALGALEVPPQPPLPPAGGVPLASTSSANPFGELSSGPLPAPVPPPPPVAPPATIPGRASPSPSTSSRT
ncbi:MAG TPA: penicillin-binding protein 2 [Acidimicrobiales bacterium]|jgi:cell division protein FtsI (penicillin-binding protein 3)|nr:penicillin-binding protein 2 [Acidimicrobiales bacterium]